MGHQAHGKPFILETRVGRQPKRIAAVQKLPYSFSPPFLLMSHHGPIAHTLEAHPDCSSENPKLHKMLEALQECAAVCTSCADACLAEEMAVSMRGCIRTNLDCADISTAAARVAGRQTEKDEALIRSMVEACLIACERCGNECESHAEHMEHCKICAGSCEQSAAACRTYLGE